MENTSRKRALSTDELPYMPQSKMHINEKIVTTHDADKMKLIHSKTIDQLFKAANRTTSVRTKPQESIQKSAPSLAEQFTIMGNGELQLRSFTGAMDVSMERKNSKCCDRRTYIQCDCSNCALPLCEYCGNSCAECGTFVCNSCVSLFGCGTQDRPICDKCAIYK